MVSAADPSSVSSPRDLDKVISVMVDCGSVVGKLQEVSAS